MSQLAMSSPDMQVRVNSSNNLGKKRGWSCEARGGVKNVVEEEEEEGGRGGKEKGNVKSRRKTEERKKRKKMR